MTNAELKELVHLLMMCGIMDKTTLESGNITDEEWQRMNQLIDKYQADKAEPEVQGDLISRSDLKREFKKIYHIVETAEQLANTMEDAIDNAPTVPLPDFKEGYKQAIIDGKTNFQRPQGEWEKPFLHSDGRWYHKCTNCHICSEVSILQDKYCNFCPNCGAKMQKGGAE